MADVGNGLKNFSKHGSVRLLGPDDVRYKLDRKRPCPFDVPAGVQAKRSCIMNNKSKKKEFDLVLPRTNSGRPILVNAHDECPRDGLFFGGPIST